MKSAVTIAQIILQVAFLVLIVLGLAFWTGQLESLVGLHMAVGGLFVLALWTVAALAVATGVDRGRATIAFVFGWIVLALGVTQQGLLVGKWHWMVRVLHFLVGLAAVPLAESIAVRIKAAPARR